MTKVLGRTDDMLIVRGVNVFPSQVEEALLSVDGTEPHYQIVLSRKDSLDSLEVHVEVQERIFFDEMKKLVEKEHEIRRKLSSALGLSVRVRLVEPGAIERTGGKAKRVVDKREISSKGGGD